MKDWLKKHYVGLTAGAVAVIALAVGVKSCNGSEDVEARIDGVEANVDSLLVSQQEVISIVNNQATRIQNNRRDIDALKNRVTAVEDSIDVHRADIDSLSARVDTVQKRQEKCPCINPKPAKKPVQRPVRPVCPAPVKHDTVVVVVKEPAPVVPVQNANGCGDDQNANVVINGNNNTVTISNNGNKNSGDTTKTTTRRVVATAEATLTVNTYVTRQSYCR